MRVRVWRRHTIQKRINCVSVYAEQKRTLARQPGSHAPDGANTKTDNVVETGPVALLEFAIPDLRGCRAESRCVERLPRAKSVCKEDPKTTRISCANFSATYSKWVILVFRRSQKHSHQHRHVRQRPTIKRCAYWPKGCSPNLFPVLNFYLSTLTTELTNDFRLLCWSRKAVWNFN